MLVWGAYRHPVVAKRGNVDDIVLDPQWQEKPNVAVGWGVGGLKPSSKHHGSLRCALVIECTIKDSMQGRRIHAHTHI